MGFTRGQQKPVASGLDNTQNKAVSYALKASRAMQRKNWSLAQNFWQAALKDSNNSKKEAPQEVYVGLSESLRQLKRFGEADNTIELGIKKLGELMPLLIERAEVARASNDWQLAKKRWRYVLEKFGTDCPEVTYVRLSEIYSRLSEFKEADSIIEAGLKIYPGSIAIRFSAARVLAEQQDLQGAVVKIKALLSSKLPYLSPGIIAISSSIFRKNGDTSSAEQLIENALLRFGFEAELLVEQAEIANQQKDWPKALGAWQLIIDERGVQGFTDHQMLLARFNASIIRRIINVDAYRKSIATYKKSTTKRKYAVFSSYTAGYDELKLPEVIDDAFDYFVFTDDEINGHGVFKICDLPVVDTDPARITKYVKTHPHTLLKNYDAAIWVDASIMIAQDIKPLLQKFLASGLPVASTPHQHRNSIQEELEACINLRKDHPEIMTKQVRKYLRRGFDGKILAENGVLLFNIKNSKLEPFLETWWNEIKKGSKRDQLSFGYALYKNNTDWYPIVKKPLNIRNIPEFVLSNHFDHYTIYDELIRLLRKD